MKKVVVALIVIAMFTAVLTGLDRFLSIVWTLLTGWIGFLLRVAPRISPDVATAAAALVAVILFALGVHWFGRARLAERWTWRASAAVTVLVFILFGAGVAMVGLTHMSYWLATSPEPIYVPAAGTTFGGKAKSTNNLRMIGLGVANHESAMHRLPCAATFDADDRSLHGWEMELLPFIGFSGNEINRKQPWDHPVNARFFQSVIPHFINPALAAPVQDGRGFGLNHYPANSYVFRPGEGVKITDITDGVSSTILAGEINNYFAPWGRPMNVRDPGLGINRSPRGFGGPPGAGGANMLFVDGHVQFMSDKISPDVLRALATPNGGKRINADAVKP